MKNFKEMILLTLIALSTTGCLSSNDFHPVKNFDIGQPEISSAPAFELTDFTIDSRYSESMFIRTSETTVDYAPYSHWVLSPEELLQNFILGASDQKQQQGKLSVNILAIELKQAENKAYFVADYTLTLKERTLTNRVISTTSISSFNPELFAKAYRKFAVKLLAELKQKISQK